MYVDVSEGVVIWHQRGGLASYLSRKREMHCCENRGKAGVVRLCSLSFERLGR
jgi:hypothetical protein